MQADFCSGSPTGERSSSARSGQEYGHTRSPRERGNGSITKQSQKLGGEMPMVKMSLSNVAGPSKIGSNTGQAITNGAETGAVPGEQSQLLQQKHITYDTKVVVDTKVNVQSPKLRVKDAQLRKNFLRASHSPRKKALGLNKDIEEALQSCPASREADPGKQTLPRGQDSPSGQLLYQEEDLDGLQRKSKEELNVKRSKLPSYASYDKKEDSSSPGVLKESMASLNKSDYQFQKTMRGFLRLKQKEDSASPRDKGKKFNGTAQNRRLEKQRSRTKQRVQLQDDPKYGTLQGQNSSTYSDDQSILKANVRRGEALGPGMLAGPPPALVDAGQRGSPEASFVLQGSPLEQHLQPAARLPENELLHGLGSCKQILNIINGQISNRHLQISHQSQPVEIKSSTSRPRRYQPGDSPLRNQLIQINKIQPQMKRQASVRKESSRKPAQMQAIKTMIVQVPQPIASKQSDRGSIEQSLSLRQLHNSSPYGTKHARLLHMQRESQTENVSKLAQLKIESHGGSHSASDEDLGVTLPNDNGKELLHQASRRVALNKAEIREREKTKTFHQETQQLKEVPTPQTLHDGQSPGAGGQPHFSMNVRQMKETSKHPKQQRQLRSLINSKTKQEVIEDPMQRRFGLHADELGPAASRHRHHNSNKQASDNRYGLEIGQNRTGREIMQELLEQHERGARSLSPTQDESVERSSSLNPADREMKTIKDMLANELKEQQLVRDALEMLHQSTLNGCHWLGLEAMGGGRGTRVNLEEPFAIRGRNTEELNNIRKMKVILNANRDSHRDFRDEAKLTDAFTPKATLMAPRFAMQQQLRNKMGLKDERQFSMQKSLDEKYKKAFSIGRRFPIHLCKQLKQRPSRLAKSIALDDMSSPSRNRLNARTQHTDPLASPIANRVSKDESEHRLNLPTLVSPRAETFVPEEGSLVLQDILSSANIKHTKNLRKSCKNSLGLFSSALSNGNQLSPNHQVIRSLANKSSPFPAAGDPSSLADHSKAQALEEIFNSRKLDTVKYMHTHHEKTNKSKSKSQVKSILPTLKTSLNFKEHHEIATKQNANEINEICNNLNTERKQRRSRLKPPRESQTMEDDQVEAPMQVKVLDVKESQLRRKVINPQNFNNKNSSHVVMAKKGGEGQNSNHMLNSVVNEMSQSNNFSRYVEQSPIIVEEASAEKTEEEFLKQNFEKAQKEQFVEVMNDEGSQTAFDQNNTIPKKLPHYARPTNASLNARADVARNQDLDFDLDVKIQDSTSSSQYLESFGNDIKNSNKKAHEKVESIELGVPDQYFPGQNEKFNQTLLKADSSQIKVTIHQDAHDQQHVYLDGNSTQHLDDLKQYFTYLQSEQQSDHSEYLPETQGEQTNSMIDGLALSKGQSQHAGVNISAANLNAQKPGVVERDANVMSNSKYASLPQSQHEPRQQVLNIMENVDHFGQEQTMRLEQLASQPIFVESSHFQQAKIESTKIEIGLVPLMQGSKNEPNITIKNSPPGQSSAIQSRTSSIKQLKLKANRPKISPAQEPSRTERPLLVQQANESSIGDLNSPRSRVFSNISQSKRKDLLKAFDVGSIEQGSRERYDQHSNRSFGSESRMNQRLTSKNADLQELSPKLKAQNSANTVNIKKQSFKIQIQQYQNSPYQSKRFLNSNLKSHLKLNVVNESAAELQASPHFGKRGQINQQQQAAWQLATDPEAQEREEIKHKWLLDQGKLPYNRDRGAEGAAKTRSPKLPNQQLRLAKKFKAQLQHPKVASSKDKELLFDLDILPNMNNMNIIITERPASPHGGSSSARLAEAQQYHTYLQGLESLSRSSHEQSYSNLNLPNSYNEKSMVRLHQPFDGVQNPVLLMSSQMSALPKPKPMPKRASPIQQNSNLGAQMRRIGEELMQHHANAEHGKGHSGKRNFQHHHLSSSRLFNGNLNSQQQRGSSMKISTSGKRVNPRVKFNEDISNVGNFSKSSASSRGPLVVDSREDLAVLEDSPSHSPRISFENQIDHRASGPQERTQVEKLTTLLGTDIRNSTLGGDRHASDDFTQTLQKGDVITVDPTSNTVMTTGTHAGQADQHSDTIEEPGVEPR